MYFLEDGKRSKEYSLFMQNVYAFKVLGKNKHDDAPDSLAMAAEMAFSKPRTLKYLQDHFNSLFTYHFHMLRHAQKHTQYVV